MAELIPGSVKVVERVSQSSKFPVAIGFNNNRRFEGLLGEGAPFIPKEPLSTPFSSSTLVPTYAQIQQDMDALVADFPGQVQKDLMGYSVGNLPIYGLRIGDDGSKPIVGFSNGIHGNERNGHLGIFFTIREILSNPTEINQKILNDLAIFIAPTINPDGMSSSSNSGSTQFGNSGTRLNLNGVDLNDDWPYYWKYSAEEETGLTPLSQPESQAFSSWFLTYAYPGRRCIGWLDFHGWTSRQEWGWLTEQIYHDSLAESAQRAAYLYTAQLMEKQNYQQAVSFSGYNSGVRPSLREYRSSRKPYIYTYVAHLSNPAAFAGLVEYPQGENPGLNAIFSVDVVFGTLLAGLDIAATPYTAVKIPKISAPMNTSNSLFGAYDSVDEEPYWFRSSGLELTYYPETSGNPPFVRSRLPIVEAWPVSVAAGAACVFSYDGSTTNSAIEDGGDAADQPADVFYLISGLGPNGRQNSVTGTAAFFEDSSFYAEPLPVSVQSAAASTDNQTMYLFGGYDGGYSTAVYAAPCRPHGQWSKVSDMPAGLQRHTANWWKEGKHVIAGGRTSSGYSNKVTIWDSADDTYTDIGTLPNSFGWHCATVYNDFLYVFGGWTGGSTRDFVCKVNLLDGTSTAITKLPYSRAEQCIAVKGNLAYLMLGRTGSSTLVDKIFEYNMDTESVTDLNYSMGMYQLPGGGITSTPQPYRIGASAYYNPKSDRIIMIGGEDSMGDIRSTVYEFSLDTLKFYLRTAPETNWGYIRSSEVFYGVSGDSFSVICRLRNPQPISEKKAPYARISILVGPLSNISRKVRMWYTVPPQGELREFAMPFTLEPGESEFRVYIRHYGVDTLLDVGGLQVLNGSDSVSAVFPALNEVQSDSLGFSQVPIRNYDKVIPHTIEGAFSPHSGCLRDVSQDYIRWITEGVLDSMSLKYHSSYSPYNTGPNGFFELVWSINGVVQFERLFENIELNYTTSNQLWRRDRVSWRIEMLNTLETQYAPMRVTFEFYGKIESVTIFFNGPAKVSSMTFVAGQSVCKQAAF